MTRFESITIWVGRVAFVSGLCCGILAAGLSIMTGATYLMLFSALAVASSAYAFNVSQRPKGSTWNEEAIRRLTGLADLSLTPILR